jgi:hypothetical protein
LESRVIAYKFLREGGRSPFTGFHWPSDGEWVEAAALEPCRAGIHACRVPDLPFWLGRELWEIELGGAVVEQERKVVAARGRLVRRAPGWHAGLLDAFCAACRARTRLRVGAIPILSGYVGDVDRLRGERRWGLAAFAAARAAELRDGPRGYERERLAQAAWLAERLGLERADLA